MAKKKPEIKKNKGKHPGGRPTIYTEEIATEIINRLTCGESMNDICRDERMPCVTSVFEWRRANKEFLKRYTRARKLQAEILLDKSRAAAEEGVEYAYSIPPTVQDAAKANAVANMLKLKIGGYQYLAERFNPKFAPHQNIKSKNVNTNNNRDLNIPIDERLNRIKTLAANHIKNKAEKKDDDGENND
jgi:hypothetical protein